MSGLYHAESHPPAYGPKCKKLRHNPTDKSANRLRDGRGLILEACNNGRKFWLLEYKFGRKRSYATMPHDYGTEHGTLAAARQWREQQQALIAYGTDPNVYAKQERTHRMDESDRQFKAVSEELIIQGRRWRLGIQATEKSYRNCPQPPYPCPRCKAG